MVACIFTGWSSCTRFFALKMPWESFRASKIADIKFGMYVYSFFALTGVTSHFFDCFRYLWWYLWSPLAVVAISRPTCALWSSTARCTLARYAWSLHFINKIILTMLSLTGMQFSLEHIQGVGYEKTQASQCVYNKIKALYNYILWIFTYLNLT